MNKVVALITLIGLLATLVLLKDTVFAQGLGNCDPSHDIKTENEPHTVSDISKRWIKAIIKAGSQNQGDACFEFTQDGTDECYVVTGLGTATASAVKVGEGRNCKDISHVEWFSDPSPSPSPETSPSPEPSPSVSPSPTPEPTPEVRPSPTATPSASPSPSPSPTQNPTPTPSVEQQHQQMMEEVKKENGGVLPPIGFK